MKERVAVGINMPKKKKKKGKANNGVSASESETSGFAMLAGSSPEDAEKFLEVARSMLIGSDGTTESMRQEVQETRERMKKLKDEINEERNLMEKTILDLKDDLKKAKDGLQQKVDKVEKLEEEMRGLREEKERELSNTRATANEEVSKYRKKYKELQNSTRGLEEFKEKKNEYDAKMQNLQTEIAELKTSYEDRLRAKDIEIQEQTEHMIERLNNEVKRTRTEMTSKMRAELDQTTKDTVAQNERLVAELKFQSNRINKLVIENKRLAKRGKKFARELSSEREMAQTNAKRIRFYARLFQRLQSEEDQRKSIEAQRDAKVVRKSSLAGPSSSSSGTISHSKAGTDPRYKQIDLELDKLLDGGSSEKLGRATDLLTSRLEERLAESLRDVENIREQNSLLEAGGSLISGERPGRSLRKASKGSVEAAAAASAERRGGSIKPQAPGTSTSNPKAHTWNYPKFEPKA